MEHLKDFLVKVGLSNHYRSSKTRSQDIWKTTWAVQIQFLAKMLVLTSKQCHSSNSKCLLKLGKCLHRLIKTLTRLKVTLSSTDRAWTVYSQAKEDHQWPILTKITSNLQEKVCQIRISIQIIILLRTQNQCWCLKHSKNKEITWQIRILTGRTHDLTQILFKGPLASIKRQWAWTLPEEISKLETKQLKLLLNTLSLPTSSRKFSNKCNLSKF